MLGGGAILCVHLAAAGSSLPLLLLRLMPLPPSLPDPFQEIQKPREARKAAKRQEQSEAQRRKAKLQQANANWQAAAAAVETSGHAAASTALASPPPELSRVGVERQAAVGAPLVSNAEDQNELQIKAAAKMAWSSSTEGVSDDLAESSPSTGTWRPPFGAPTDTKAGIVWESVVMKLGDRANLGGGAHAVGLGDLADGSVSSSTAPMAAEGRKPFVFGTLSEDAMEAAAGLKPAPMALSQGSIGSGAAVGYGLSGLTFGVPSSGAARGGAETVGEDRRAMPFPSVGATSEFPGDKGKFNVGAAPFESSLVPVSTYPGNPVMPGFSVLGGLPVMPAPMAMFPGAHVFPYAPVPQAFFALRPTREPFLPGAVGPDPTSSSAFSAAPETASGARSSGRVGPAVGGSHHQPPMPQNVFPGLEPWSTDGLASTGSQAVPRDVQVTGAAAVHGDQVASQAWTQPPPARAPQAGSEAEMPSQAAAVSGSTAAAAGSAPIGTGGRRRGRGSGAQRAEKPHVPSASLPTSPPPQQQQQQKQQQQQQQKRGNRRGRGQGGREPQATSGDAAQKQPSAVDNSGSQAAPVASRGAQGTRGRGGRGRAATPKRENDGVDKIAGDRRQPARRGRGGRGGRGGSGTAATTPAGSGAPAVAVRATPAEASH